MTFTYKLARRLAVLRATVVVALATVAVGCTNDGSPDPLEPPLDSLHRSSVRVKVTPDSITLEAGQGSRFSAYGMTLRGDSTPITVLWSASGGTITPDGMFTAAATGTFKVFGTGRKRQGVDSAIVVVVPPAPSIVRVALTPHTATVAPGQTRAFVAEGRLSDSSTTPIGAKWSATGGKVDASGSYTAGTTPGKYRVIAANTAGTLADTAEVTVPEPEAPVLAQVIVAPATATVVTGATQQFRAYGRNSAGDSVAVAVQYSATGGSITTAGLYTASSAAGSFRVVATQNGGTLADTANVSITAPQPSPSPSPSPTPQSGWYVSPTGSSGVAGTASAPWSLAYALSGAGGTIRPGDTVWLRGGTYRGAFTSNLAGTSSAPIVVRQYPGERATVDGNFVVFGQNTWFWGFEVINSNASSGSVEGFNVKSPGSKFINLVIHDASGNGMGVWAEAPDAELNGLIMYNNGRKGSGGHVPDVAHGIYAQNCTGKKLIKDVVLFQTHAYGLHFYTSASCIRDFTVEGMTMFNNGMLDGSNVSLGGGSPIVNLQFNKNMSYQTPGFGNGVVWLGRDTYSGPSMVADNYFAGGDPAVRLFLWNSLDFQRNTIVPGDGQLVEGQGPWSGMRFSGNSWYGVPGTIEFSGSSGQWTFSQWKANLGASTDTYTSGKPTGLKVFVRANQYEPGRANVTVYNWSGASSVTVSIPELAGKSWDVKHVYDFYGAPVASGSGSTVTFPIVSKPAPQPVGGKASPPSTGTAFGVYIVVPR